MKRLHFSKKANDAMSLVGKIVIVLLVVFFLVFIVRKYVGQANMFSKCEGQGGYPAYKCNISFSYVANHFKLDNGKLCCMAKPGKETQADFVKWKTKATKEDYVSNKIGSLIDMGAGFLGHIYAKGKYTSSSIVIAINKTPQNPSINPAKAINSISNRPIYEGDIIQFEAQNNVKKSDYCSFNIGKVKEAGGRPIVDGDLVQSLKMKTGCVQGTRLEMIGPLSYYFKKSNDVPVVYPGMYEVYMLVKNKKGDLLDSRAILVNVTKRLDPSTGEGGKDFTPKIEAGYTLVPRENINHCYVYSFSPVTQEQARAAAYGTYKNNKCDNEQDMDISGDYSVHNKTLPSCFYFTDGPNSASAVRINTTHNCDVIHYVDSESYEQMVHSCVGNCDKYANSKVDCYGIKPSSRDYFCQNGISCQWEKTGNTNTCADCTKVSSCTDYSSRKSCKANQCLADSKCYWAFALFGGSCKASS